MTDRLNNGTRELPESPRERAAWWLVRLERGPLTDQEESDYLAWIRASAAHEAAMRALHSFDRLTREVGERQRRVGESVTKPSVTERIGPRGMGAILASAAACLILGVAVALIGAPQLHEEGARFVYATQIGDQEVVRLPDDSLIHLNTNTRVDVRYSREARKVSLLQGEAHFEVEEDSDRPFTVSAGDRIVRAVGTAFTVSMVNLDLEVTVSEGVVDVLTVDEKSTLQARATRSPAVTTLTAQDRVLMSDDGNKVTHLEEAEIARLLAWRQGMLAFEDETIEEVLNEVSRYSDSEFLIADQALGELRFGGLFRVGNTEALLEALRKSYGIRWERISHDQILLSRETDR